MDISREDCCQTACAVLSDLSASWQDVAEFAFINSTNLIVSF